MQISSRFTMAIHMFACIDTFKNQKMTSDFMAGSIGTNPVIIRKLLQKLKAAGLITVSRGTGGVEVTRPLEEIICAGGGVVPFSRKPESALSGRAKYPSCVG